MNIESASRTGPRSLVADVHAMSAEALRGLSCRWRTLVIVEIVTIVLLAACGGGGSQQPPVTPTISTISPNTSVAGGAAFTLTINGTNFVAASMVNFGGSAPATTFVNSTQLTAAIPAASIVSTGAPAVTVTNPAPGGGTHASDLPPSLHGNYPASSLLWGSPTLRLRIRTLALVVLPLVASPLASVPQVPTFRLTASLASSGHLSCRMPPRP
jgi:hypothetical protein